MDRSIPREVETAGQAVRLPPQHYLTKQGYTPSAVFVLVDGTTKGVRLDLDGNEVVASFRWPLSIVGADSALSGCVSPLSEVAVGPCEVIRVPTSRFLALVRGSTEVAHFCYRIECEHSVQTARWSADSVASAAPGRIMRFLESLTNTPYEPVAQSLDGYLKVRMPLKAHEIASLCGITKWHFSRTVALLERQGRIRRDRGWILIPKEARAASGLSQRFDIHR